MHTTGPAGAQAAATPKAAKAPSAPEGEAGFQSVFDASAGRSETAGARAGVAPEKLEIGAPAHRADDGADTSPDADHDVTAGSNDPAFDDTGTDLDGIEPDIDAAQTTLAVAAPPRADTGPASVGTGGPMSPTHTMSGRMATRMPNDGRAPAEGAVSPGRAAPEAGVAPHQKRVTAQQDGGGAAARAVADRQTSGQPGPQLQTETATARPSPLTDADRVGHMTDIAEQVRADGTGTAQPSSAVGDRPGIQTQSMMATVKDAMRGKTDPDRPMTDGEEAPNPPVMARPPGQSLSSWAIQTAAAARPAMGTGLQGMASSVTGAMPLPTQMADDMRLSIESGALPDDLTLETLAGAVTSDRGGLATPTTAQVVALRPENPIPAMRQMAEALARKPDGGVEIQLQPEELGRVRLAMTQTETGMVVSITADRPETLDLMRRHIDSLARALTDLGYESTEFSFADGRQDGSAQGDGAPAGSAANAGTANGMAQDMPQETAPRRIDSRASQGLDLML